MRETKKELKFFTIPAYRKEEEYLSKMHAKGWGLIRVSWPCVYHFEKCEPEKMSYRLDYNQEGVAHKSEYVQMFADCGWEYLFDFVGYSYFRKPAEDEQENEEIFCDDASRLEMMRRVFKGRVTPLIIIFFCMIIPQLSMNSMGYGGGSRAQDLIAICFTVLAALYLVLFAGFAIQFYQYEKNLDLSGNRYKAKYVGVAALIVFFTAFVGFMFWNSHQSEYKFEDRDKGFTIESERLNETLTEEFDLKKGDVVEVVPGYDGGEWYLEICKEGEEPIFTGHTASEYKEPFSVMIQEDGRYRIICRGKRAQGSLDVTIR
ncbi:MAG: DUF2812 domain-containing protein [Lachnospiraceae bacterium]|nr:DUF2812 domain-containing protein [Lachnospiraceae bacterium]